MENCKHDYQEVYGKEDLKALSDARNAEKKALAENKRLMQTKGRTMTELQKAIKEWVDNDFKGDILVNDGGLNYTITPMYRGRHENPLFKYVKPVKRYVYMKDEAQVISYVKSGNKMFVRRKGADFAYDEWMEIDVNWVTLLALIKTMETHDIRTCIE